MHAKDAFSVDAARHASERGELGEWVAAFLASPGSDNAPLGEKLTTACASWLGPIELPLDELRRLAGSPDQPVLVEVDESEWRDDVDEMHGRIEEEGWEPPPLIATWQGDHLRLEDGNHRAESLRRAGVAEAWTIVGFDDDAARDRFQRQHQSASATSRPSSRP